MTKKHQVQPLVEFQYDNVALGLLTIPYVAAFF